MLTTRRFEDSAIDEANAGGRLPQQGFQKDVLGLRGGLHRLRPEVPGKKQKQGTTPRPEERSDVVWSHVPGEI